MLNDRTLSEAIDAIRWLMKRNIDFAGAVHVIALLRALVEASDDVGHRARVEVLVDELVQRWSYWAPDALLALQKRDTMRSPPPEVA